jgi:hypothetical protein
MIWSDNSGKRLFEQPHIDVLKGNQLPDLFQKIKDSGDERSRTILVNLILEHLADILLGHLIKNYEDFVKDTKPSFYLKLSLLKAFDLIPEQVLASIDCLREIRNRFAHRLEITKFSDLDDKIIQKINQTVKGATFDSEEEKETLEQKISRLEFHAFVGLDGYEPNLRLLADKVNGKEFREHLDSEYKKRLLEQFDLLDKYVKDKDKSK